MIKRSISSGEVGVTPRLNLFFCCEFFPVDRWFRGVIGIYRSPSGGGCGSSGTACSGPLTLAGQGERRICGRGCQARAGWTEVGQRRKVEPRRRLHTQHSHSTLTHTHTLTHTVQVRFMHRAMRNFGRVRRGLMNTTLSPALSLGFKDGALCGEWLWWARLRSNHRTTHSHLSASSVRITLPSLHRRCR
jgi:hypothetical protein